MPASTTVTVVLGSAKVIFALELQTGGGIKFNQSTQLTTSTLFWESGGLTGPGTLRVVQAGTINVVSGANIAGSTFINDGSINLGRSLTLSAGAVIENRNTIKPVDGANIGTVLASGPAVDVVNNTGFLRKSTGSGNGNMTFGGSVQPGQSLGTLSQTDDATFTNTGNLAIELGNGINAFAAQDIDGDSINNLLEWALGGKLSTPDPGRILSLLSVAPGTPGTPATFTCPEPSRGRC